MPHTHPSREGELCSPCLWSVIRVPQRPCASAHGFCGPQNDKKATSGFNEKLEVTFLMPPKAYRGPQKLFSFKQSFRGLQKLQVDAHGLCGAQNTVGR